MKTIFTLSTVMLLTAASYAQTYAKPRAIVADPSSCNNTAVVEIYNNTPHGWVWYTQGGWFGTQTLVEHLDTVTGVCFNDPISGTDGFDLYSSNGYISHSLLYSSIIMPDFNYTLTSYVAPTNETSEDGSFTLEFDSAVTSYDLIIFQDANHEPTIDIIDGNTMELSDLNVGFITIHIDNPLDPYDYAHFRIYAGDPADLYINDGLEVNISYHNANSTCEGWINLQPVNTTNGGSIYYTWADDQFLDPKSTTRTGLCPGTYSVYTSEMVAGYYTKAHIDTIVITDDAATTIAPDLFTVEQDWIAYYSETWCWVYDWETADSLKTFADTLYNADSLLIATYDTIKYVGYETFTTHDSIIKVADSTVVYDRTIYCDEEFPEFLLNHDTSEENNGQAYDDFLSTTAVLDETLQASIYPNPTAGDLHVDFKKTGTYKIDLLDYRGSHIETLYVVNDDEMLLSTADMANGIYILLIYSENGVQQHKFVKSGQ